MVGVRGARRVEVGRGEARKRDENSKERVLINGGRPLLIGTYQPANG